MDDRLDYRQTLEHTLQRLERLRTPLSHNPQLAQQLGRSIATVQIQLGNEQRRFQQQSTQ
jgi:hypothetical protein